MAMAKPPNGKPESVERKDGGHKSKRYGDERDDCGAHIHQEHEEHDDHKDGSLNEGTLYIIYGAVDEALLTVYVGSNLHIGRELTL